jgi:hypothetical protein
VPATWGCDAPRAADTPGAVDYRGRVQFMI